MDGVSFTKFKKEEGKLGREIICLRGSLSDLITLYNTFQCMNSVS